MLKISILTVTVSIVYRLGACTTRGPCALFGDVGAREVAATARARPRPLGCGIAGCRGREQFLLVGKPLLGVQQHRIRLSHLLKGLLVPALVGVVLQGGFLVGLFDFIVVAPPAHPEHVEMVAGWHGDDDKWH